MQTRSKLINSVVGKPEPLCTSQLPTKEDIWRAFLYYTKVNKRSKHHAATQIAEEIKIIYDRGGIPTIQLKSIANGIHRLVEKFKSLCKCTSAKRSTSHFQSEVHSFKNLFNVCTCKCIDSGITDRYACTCPLLNKVPLMEWDFWIDQNTDRQMYIGSIDKETTIKLRKRSVRSDSQTACKPRKQCDAFSVDESISDDLANDTNDDFIECDSESSDDNVLPRNTHKYSELCKAMDRCKISNRDACLIVNAMLKDLDLLRSDTAIDPAKLRRQRRAMRKSMILTHDFEMKKMICIGFDGKREITLAHECGLRRSVKEDHYTIVAFPEEKYVDHITPESGKAQDVVKEILSVLTYRSSLQSLNAVLCDGTVSNTGKYGGVIRRIEDAIGRPTQWLICLLHTNELPLRKFISVLGGGHTTGPSSSTNEILSQLNFDPINLPISDFTPVSGKVNDVSDIAMKDLSYDQQYLLKACLFVQQGNMNSDYKMFLQTAKPGAVHHARWLTTASRILRLYMSKRNSSPSLCRIVRVILNAYAPTWFQIKQQSSCFDGARNFYFLMISYHELGTDDWNIVESVFLNNNYYAHPENILLSALSDENEDIRKFALDKVIQARDSISVDGLRLFDKDKVTLNVNAASYIDMIDWNEAIYVSPPLLSNLSNDEIMKCSFASLWNIPCHSQAVERCVQDISATTSKVFGHDSRHGMVLQAKKSRKEIPVLDNKAKYIL
jgi:hypothetical protein